jgi:hypothetical protein
MMTLPAVVACLALGQPLADEEFDRQFRSIVPAEKELRWREVKWVPTLWEGIRTAQREDRPILLYAMNGHPLGCT